MSASCLALSRLLNLFFSVLAHQIIAPHGCGLFYHLGSPRSAAGDGPGAQSPWSGLIQGFTPKPSLGQEQRTVDFLGLGQGGKSGGTVEGQPPPPQGLSVREVAP